MSDWRNDFSDFGDSAYFNCAYHGPMPRVAQRALAAAVELRRNPALLRDEDHFAFPNAYRAAVAGLLGCDADTVALTDSTTAGMMVLAHGLDWRSGDQIVTPAGEFPANRLPWLWLGRRQGVELVEVEVPPGRPAVEAIAAAITPRTRLVAATWVRYSDGRRFDLQALGDLCRSRGVLFAVDACQGLGGLPFDLGETPCDLLACSGYKWLLGPYGLGFVRLQPELSERLEVANANWFSVVGAERFDRLADLPLRLRPGARRFDANEPANFFNVAAGTAALRYVAGVTPAAVEAHCRALNRRLVAGLPAPFMLAGGELEESGRSNILCLESPDLAAAERARAALRHHRISVSSREGSIRISPHVYNTPQEVDRLLEALDEAARGGDGESRPRPPSRPEPAATDEETPSPRAVLRELIGLES